MDDLDNITPDDEPIIVPDEPDDDNTGEGEGEEDNPTNPDEGTVSTQLDILKAQLEAEGFVELDDETLERELLWAKYAINDRLAVEPSREIEPRHKGIQIQLCIEAISKYGADGEVTHSENGISRNYDSASRYSKATLSLIIPKIGIVL